MSNKNGNPQALHSYRQREEYKSECAERMRRFWRDPEYRAKQILKRQGIKRGPFTEEHRANISRAQKARYAGKQQPKAVIERKRWLRNYGLTSQQFDLILLQQGGKCAICRRSPDREQRFWAIDHDYSTDLVRGVLCLTCNLLIGYAGDEQDLLRKAIDYLEYGRVGILEDPTIGVLRRSWATRMRKQKGKC